jgi:hypothetical protein
MARRQRQTSDEGLRSLLAIESAVGCTPRHRRMPPSGQPFSQPPESPPSSRPAELDSSQIAAQLRLQNLAVVFLGQPADERIFPGPFEAPYVLEAQGVELLLRHLCMANCKSAPQLTTES